MPSKSNSVHGKSVSKRWLLGSDGIAAGPWPRFCEGQELTFTETPVFIITKYLLHCRRKGAPGGYSQILLLVSPIHVRKGGLGLRGRDLSMSLTRVL